MVSGPLESVEELAATWRKEFRGVDTSVLPPLVRLTQLASLMDAFQRQVLEPFEISYADYAALSMLRRAGPPYELTPSQLYGRLERSSGGMTKILKRLEEAGWVRRSPDPNDGRGWRIGLTKRGFDLQDRLFHAYLQASKDLMAPLSATKQRELDRALSQLVETFANYVGK
jgi:DNA-binding MarR family transcriptional regulator